MEERDCLQLKKGETLLMRANKLLNWSHISLSFNYSLSFNCVVWHIRHRGLIVVSTWTWWVTLADVAVATCWWFVDGAFWLGLRGVIVTWSWVFFLFCLWSADNWLNWVAWRFLLHWVGVKCARTRSRFELFSNRVCVFNPHVACTRCLLVRNLTSFIIAWAWDYTLRFLIIYIVKTLLPRWDCVALVGAEMLIYSVWLISARTTRKWGKLWKFFFRSIPKTIFCTSISRIPDFSP